jgi:excisionase family DNA binding protein
MEPEADGLIGHDPWLTPKEAAAYLKISYRTLWRVILNGQLQPKFIGQQMRFKRSAVDAALLSQRPRLLPNRVEPIRRGVSSLTEHLKRRAESWPNN